jgi:hypothetical protein
MLVDLEVEKEINEVVEKARQHILASKFPQEIAAYQTQESFLKRIEEAAITWTDSKKPDIRTVLFELHLLRAFRAMLRTLPKPRKKKPRAARNLAQRRPRTRRRTT